MKQKGKTNPPGRRKIMASFSRLMKEKDFHSITTAQIARNASVTEGLIYKYFKDKKDLLYQVLNALFTQFLIEVETGVARESTAIDKLRLVIHTSLESYTENRLLSKMLLLEVRNSLEFFSSPAYAMVRQYAALILDIIQEGVDRGEIRPGTDPYILRKVILGSIEHACLGEIIFGRELDIDEVSKGMCDIILNGVKA